MQTRTVSNPMVKGGVNYPHLLNYGEFDYLIEGVFYKAYPTGEITGKSMDGLCSIEVSPGEQLVYLLVINKDEEISVTTNGTGELPKPCNGWCPFASIRVAVNDDAGRPFRLGRDSLISDSWHDVEIQSIQQVTSGPFAFVE